MKSEFSLFCDRSLRVDDHQHDERQQEHHREDDGDAVEVLLHDARARLRGVHGAGDHVGYARALAGMQQDEHDEAQARDDEQDEHDDKERVQGVSLLSIENDRLHKSWSIPEKRLPWQAASSGISATAPMG